MTSYKDIKTSYSKYLLYSVTSQALLLNFKQQEISDKIAKIITPEGTNAEVEVIYQTLDNLNIACPDHTGDWYFSGNYPTPGGNKVVNKAFVNWKEGNNQRAY